MLELNKTYTTAESFHTEVDLDTFLSPIEMQQLSQLGLMQFGCLEIPAGIQLIVSNITLDTITLNLVGTTINIPYGDMEETMELFGL